MAKKDVKVIISLAEYEKLTKAKDVLEEKLRTVARDVREGKRVITEYTKEYGGYSVYNFHLLGDDEIAEVLDGSFLSDYHIIGLKIRRRKKQVK